jgi:hypothetical protein
MNEIEKKQNNAKLAYEYTKSTWATVSASYDVITVKLTTALGFIGLLMSFAASLSDKSWLVGVKMIVCALLVTAIIACCIGLKPIGTGEFEVDPDDFLDPKTGYQYGESEEESYLYIARGLNDAMKSLKKNREFRLRCLSAAIFLSSLASIGFAISIMGKAMMFPA